MLGQLYEEALGGERCWLRHDDGRRHRLPVHSWLGGHGADRCFDRAVVELCQGPTIDLGCGPGRLVTHLIQRGIPALGVDQSETAVRLARRSGAPVLLRDLFDPLPGTGRWETVLLADGNVGLGGDPWRVLRRAAELISETGRCVVEFEAAGAQAFAPFEDGKTMAYWTAPAEALDDQDLLLDWARKSLAVAARKQKPSPKGGGRGPR